MKSFKQDEELLRKALVCVYRHWSFYWGLSAIKCRTDKYSAFVEFEKYILWWGADSETLQETETDFPDKAKEIIMASEQNNHPLCKVFFKELFMHHEELVEQVGGKVEPVQEWRLLREGKAELFKIKDYDNLALTDSYNEKSYYKIDGILDKECEIITSGTVRPDSKLQAKGFFRKSGHLVYGRRYENLDLFFDTMKPILLSLREGRRGMMAYPRKITNCPCKVACKFKIDLLALL